MSKRWNVVGKLPAGKKPCAIDTIITLLLANRNLTTLEQQAYLNPTISLLSIKNVGIDPKQLRKALKKISQAIENKEQIVVFGDYDVDGITASAILWETINELGGVCMPFIPGRKVEGYGLSKKGIDTLRAQIPEVRLIITVDNGIVANEAVAYANELGITVIVTDHHTTGDTLPDAYAIVHTTQLCGAGVAYLLSLALREQRKDHEVIAGSENDRHLELAALGTVADLVALIGANRVIVKEGLAKLQTTTRPGLVALYQQAGITPTNIGVYEIGYMIGPRLNASGRIGTAMDSLRLLCTRDAKRATLLASKLELTNKERQELLKTAAEHAIGTFEEDGVQKKLLVIGHQTYEEGIIGLVAGKLVEAFYRPAIVFSFGEKQSKASARSIKGFDIVAFLRSHEALFINLGGHPMAAGCTIETTQFAVLKKTLEDTAEELLDDQTLQRVLAVDCVLPFVCVTDELFRAIEQLGPFGMGNPEPVFATKGAILIEKRSLGREGKHVRFLFEQDGKKCEGIGFGMGELAKEFAVGDKVDVAYTIDQNTWNGNTKLQLKVRDVRGQH